MIALSIYVLLGTLIAHSEWRRHSRGESLNAMTAFNAAYFVLFVFVPINVMCLGEDVVRQKYAYETYGFGGTSTALSVFFCYVLFSLGYWWKSADTRKINRDRLTFSLRESERVAKAVFFVGAALMAIYTLQVGGISEVISQAAAFRFGETILEGKYVFYRYFCQLSSDAFVLLFAVVAGKRLRGDKITTRDNVLLYCALVFFVYYALSTAGRRPFIYPILLCFFVYWSIGAKLKKTAVIALALVFVVAGIGTILGPIILSGNFFTALDVYEKSQAGWRGALEITYSNATQGLADSYMHFVAMQKAPLWQFGFLTDITNLPRDILPSRLLGFQRDWTLTRQINDFFGEQLPEGPDGGPLGGGEPLGLHGYLLVNFGYAGMFACFFVLGLFYKWLHIRFRPANPKDAVGWLIYWWLVFGFFVYLRDGSLLLVIKEQLTWWVLAALLIRYCSIRQAEMKTFRLRAGHGVA